TERGDVQTLRVHRPGDLPGRTVLAAAVHRLQDEQHPLPRTADLRAGVEPLLQRREVRADRGELRGGPSLRVAAGPAGQPRGAGRVDGGQVHRLSRGYAQLLSQ